MLVGSINDLEKIGAEEPDSLLDKVKKKIILFDGEQTRFIYKDGNNKQVNIQGLSGSGKTELLLHKLKDIYTSTSNKKTFFTCHNKILASNLRTRIPEFFNFMKVEKQIEWESSLWVVNAWGSEKDMNSGVYSYICNFYNIPFYRWSIINSFDKVCARALEDIRKLGKDKFEYALDYILIDESQDFPQSFFDLCDWVTSEKIYIAGDIFQNIFEENFENKIVNADFVLNRCYRTDPRTLMFAQAIGMGLFEKTKLNWLTLKEWEGSGYIVEKSGRNISLYRESIRRFEDLEVEDTPSMILQNNTTDITGAIRSIIQGIIRNNPTVQPEDIAIILLDRNNYIYDLANELEFDLMNNFSWLSNKGYESKEKIEGCIFISNRNNVKGLEFPFVICVTNSLSNYLRYRNTLYTMLTRSFIQSYLLINNCDQFDVLQKGLEIINSKKCIRTKEPTEVEMEHIKNTIIKIKESTNISYKDFLSQVFDELKIDPKSRNKFEKAITDAIEDKFNKELIVEFS